MTKKQTPDTIDDIVAENAWLHQTLDMQRTIQAGTNSELLRLNDVNNSLRRIIAYVLLQSGGSYRISHKTLITGDSFAGDISLEVDTITSDWVIKLNKEKETNAKD